MEAGLRTLKFLSTLSLRRATILVFCGPQGSGNFYPRSPCGERQPALYQLYDTYAFLSTLSLRRATGNNSSMLCNVEISIHALLAESDRHWQVGQKRLRHFYPRSPCGERLHRTVNIQRPATFLSTLSLRRATAEHHANSQKEKFLSTLSLRRATQWEGMKSLSEVISIHALLAESDVLELQCILG